jgi:hypothetical protein
MPLAADLSLLAFVVGLCGIPFFTMPQGREAPFVFGILAMLTTTGALGGVLWLLRPVERIKVGDQLQFWPGGNNSPRDVLLVEFGPDPGEDYVDGALPIPLCEATITVRRARPVRLIISVGDAARLREWADANAIPVSDPEGYARASRPNAVQHPDEPEVFWAGNGERRDTVPRGG